MCGDNSNGLKIPFALMETQHLISTLLYMHMFNMFNLSEAIKHSEDRAQGAIKSALKNDNFTTRQQTAK